MIAIFLKELRENARWAALIFGAFLVVVYFQVRSAPAYLMFELAQPPQTVFAPLAGLLMGLVQSLFETRPDNWAFVVHRPVPLWRIFIAKCTAGLLLLYVSVELPFLLAALWAAQPGHLAAPFQARMILPTLAIALNAGVYYFVAIVITLRRSRWFGTRVLPLGLALASSIAIAYATEFWQAMLISLAGHALGAMAAWDAFSTGGAADRRGAPAFALGAAIYTGAIGLGCGLVASLGIFQNGARWTQYRMARDGQMVRVTTTLEHGERNCVITDPQGRVLPEYEGIDPTDPASASRFLTFDSLIDTRNQPWPASEEMHGSYSNSVPGVGRLSAVAKPGVRMRALCYYFMHRRIIEMYDVTTRVLIGTVGPAGFAPPGVAPSVLFPPDEPLNLRISGGHTLAFPTIVYWLELDQRRVRPVFNTTADDPVTCARDLPPQTSPSIVIATRSHIHLLASSGQPLTTIPLDYDLTQTGVGVVLLPANQHVMVWAGQILPCADEPASELCEYAADGTLVRRQQLPPLEEGGSARLPRTAAFGFVYPPGALPLYRSWLMDFMFDLNTQRYAHLFHGCLLAASLLAALLTLGLSRRYGLNTGKSLAWTLGNLLLGPAGIAAFVGLNELPAREPCPACRGRRISTKLHCPHCGAALPPPAQDGREIFEPAETLSQDFELEPVV